MKPGDMNRAQLEQENRRLRRHILRQSERLALLSGNDVEIIQPRLGQGNVLGLTIKITDKRKIVALIDTMSGQRLDQFSKFNNVIPDEAPKATVIRKTELKVRSTTDD